MLINTSKCQLAESKNNELTNKQKLIVWNGNDIAAYREADDDDNAASQIVGMGQSGAQKCG